MVFVLSINTIVFITISWIVLVTYDFEFWFYFLFIFKLNPTFAKDAATYQQSISDGKTSYNDLQKQLDDLEKDKMDMWLEFSF